jgi:hypothetical protein
VAYLVRCGFDVNWVLEEIPLPVFNTLTQIAYKHDLEMQRRVGMTITVALSAVLSPDASKKADEAIQSAMQEIDDTIYGRKSSRVEEYEEVYEDPRRKKPKRKPRSKANRTMEMAQRFHAQFSKMTGLSPAAGLDAAIKRAQASHVKILESQGE